MALIILDGMLFKVRLPCGGWKNPDLSTEESEWDALLKLRQRSFTNGPGHQLAWCVETTQYDDGELCGLVRSCKKLHYPSFSATHTRDTECGFRPVLIPLSVDGKTLDRSVFNGVKDGEIVTMYSLLMDNKPVKVSQDGTAAPVKYKPGATLTLTDTFFGAQYLIPFIITHGLAISAGNLVAGVSYDDLWAFTYLGDEY